MELTYKLKEKSLLLELFNILEEELDKFWVSFIKFGKTSYLIRISSTTISITKISLRNCFFVKSLAALDKIDLNLLFNSSSIIRAIFICYNKFKSELDKLKRDSLLFSLTWYFKTIFSANPLSNLSVTLFFAVFVNSLLAYLYKNDFILIDWIIRLALLVVSAFEVTSNSNFSEIFNNSFFLKIFCYAENKNIKNNR